MASANFKKTLLSNEKFKQSVNELYCSSNYELYADRLISLTKEHNVKYGEVDFYVSSPGRIEVAGNHTDHNNGKVLCASISVDTLGAISKTDDNTIIIESLGYPPVVVDLNDIEYKEFEEGTSNALVKGVCKYLINNGYKIGGFTATTTSNVFKGAGVSSSASFEVLVAECLNILYNDKKMNAIFKAQAAQFAENKYFGKPCGLMDQSAIAIGGVSYIDFKDTTKPVVVNRKWQWVKDISIVLINTGGDHCDLTDHYAAIRSEMEAIAEFYGQKTLRFVDEVKFKNDIPELLKKFSGRSIMRALHFYSENKRVVEADSAIENGDLEMFLINIARSGNSSYKLLQNCYAPQDTDQLIPVGLAIAEDTIGLRACRVHGGGFAGTILCFVDNEYVQDFMDRMTSVFGNENVFNIGIRNVGTTEVQL